MDIHIEWVGGQSEGPKGYYQYMVRINGHAWSFYVPEALGDGYRTEDLKAVSERKIREAVAELLARPPLPIPPLLLQLAPIILTKEDFAGVTPIEAPIPLRRG